MFSGFNQPDDISLDDEYEAICGITKEELIKYFSEPILEMATKLNCSYEEMIERLQLKYDGYHFSERMTEVFNPFSLLNAFKKLRLNSYWFKSGTPTYLMCICLF